MGLYDVLPCHYGIDMPMGMHFTKWYGNVTSSECAVQIYIFLIANHSLCAFVELCSENS